MRPGVPAPGLALNRDFVPLQVRTTNLNGDSIMAEMPVDVLNHRLGKIRDNGDIDFDNDAWAVDIDEELQRKFIFIPREEIDAVEIVDDGHFWRAGTGPESVRAGKSDNPNWLHNSAINAMAICQHLMREQDRLANEERLAKRPKPGVYHAVRNGHYFPIIVTVDQRIMVPQSDGGMDDYTHLWDKEPGMWALSRIDITDGTVQS